MDRGLDGIRWSVTGAWVGSLEVWLEAVGDGVVVHHYARLDPADATGSSATGMPGGPPGGAGRPGPARRGRGSGRVGAQGRPRAADAAPGTPRATR